MKFYGTPDMSVFEINRSRKDINNIYKRRKLLFSFDKNGEFVTADKKLIERLIKKFRHDETEIKVDETINIVSETEIKSENSLRHCKKCEFTCETQGQLLKHYREKHTKGGD